VKIKSTQVIRSIGVAALGLLVGSALISCNITPRIVAFLYAFPPQGKAPLLVEFDGSKSLTAEGTIVSYHWDFDDGSTSDQAKVEHTFVAPRPHKVVLTVKNDLGHTDKATKYIVVGNEPMPVTVGTDWRVQDFKGMEDCDGPTPDAAGKPWYETEYNDSNWIELSLHDGNPFYGTNRDFFFRTPIDRITEQMLRRMEIFANVGHNGSFRAWINGKAIPASVFGRSETEICHKDTGSLLLVSGVINDYLKVGHNTMAVHLSTGPSKLAQPFLSVVLTMQSK
jgi:PKD repeat protein